MAPTFDMAAWAGTVDTALADGIATGQLLVFAVALFGAIAVAFLAGLLVSQVRARG